MNYWKVKEECLSLTEKMQKDYHLDAYYYYNKANPIIPNGYFTIKTDDRIIREHFYVDIQNNKNEVARLYLNIQLIVVTLEMESVAVKKRYLEHTNLYATKDDLLHSKGKFKELLIKIRDLYDSLK